MAVAHLFCKYCGSYWFKYEGISSSCAKCGHYLSEPEASFRIEMEDER